ncbi:MAG: hypothetical protein ABSE63_08350 [Thermoguttaceae bacterium]|jgi:hypothetical protein
MDIKNSIVIEFVPDLWGSLDRFLKFYSSTYNFNKDIQKALPGAANHFHKSIILLSVARRHVPLLQEDQEQIDKTGHTPALRAKELSALIESIILDLYSSIDCARKIVTDIFKKYQGVKKSTRKFFKACIDGKVNKSIPEDIRHAFKSCDWYPYLLRLRDTLTHSDIGSCHMDSKTNKVFYMHAGLGNGQKALVIDDIFLYLEKLITQVNQFLGKVFAYLNTTLLDKELWEMCGIFGGRIYSRFVKPSEALDFNSGRCDAFKWFEKPENPRCPFAKTCGAYKRRII